MPFDYNIQHYTFADLKKLFNVKEGEQITPEEMDARIATIVFSAKTSPQKDDLKEIESFMHIAKEKFLLLERAELIQYNNVHPMTERLRDEFKPNVFLDKNEHAVIEHRKDIYIPDEDRLFNINSSDRDKVAWPHASFFEIDLPTSIKDVTVMGLYDYNFYFSIYNFTDFYQNTKLSFSLTSNVTGSDPLSGTPYDVDLSDTKLTITLPDGVYNDATLPSTMTSLMNLAVTSALEENGVLSVYDKFDSYLDVTSGKFSVYNKDHTFTLHFDQNESYTANKWQVRDVYQLENSWGLGYFLGFDKKAYASDSVFNSNFDGSNNVNAITSDRIFTSVLKNTVFLEIDGFNHAFQTSRVNGKVNSYFARIPIQQGYSNDSGGVENRVVSAERISKLKIKLRFHNGILLDTQGQDFDITINFRCKK